MYISLLCKLRRISPNPLGPNVRLLVTGNSLGTLKNRSVWMEQIRKNSDKKGLVSREGSGADVSTNVKEIVKESTKTASYSAVILLGVGMTAMIFYVMFRELFSSKSPNNVYTKAVQRCSKDPKVLDALGEPIKAFGEENRRGRRRHASHMMFEKNGIVHMRMRFYLKGARKSATAHLEVKENASGNYEYNYLFVQMDDFPNRVIVVEDFRQDTSKALTTPSDASELL